MDIQENYNKILSIDSDIKDNLSVLNYFAKQCDHITEMGVRAMFSSWAFLAGLKQGGTFIGIDIVHPKEYGIDIEKIKTECEKEGIKFNFVQGDTLEAEIEPTDMLFIDTIHTKTQLSKELKMHASRVRKFMAFHDTVSCPELCLIIDDFLHQNKNWRVVFIGNLSNGLIVIQNYKYANRTE